MSARLALVAAVIGALGLACGPRSPAPRPASPPAAEAPPRLVVETLGVWQPGVFDGGAAEIVVHDPKRQRLYVANRHTHSVDVLDVRDPKALAQVGAWSVADHGATLNSVAVTAGGDRVLAVVSAKTPTDPGRLVVFDGEGAVVAAVEVGAGPDMVAATPDGRFALIANEAEPTADYGLDPAGSVSVVSLADHSVRTVGFESLDASPPAGLHRASPPDTPLSRDLEPEYVAVSGDSRTAWVTLQEASALAVIDVEAATLQGVLPLGARPGAGLRFDLSDKDGGIHRESWPVAMLYQPDAIAAFEHEGKTFLVTANEGDARDYPGYSEETRVAKLTLDPEAFPNAAELQRPEKLGRLKTSRAVGDTDGDGDHDTLVAFGSRSFTIWSAAGDRVWDSGDDFEARLEVLDPARFNSQGAISSFDSRSDDKGVEPEGVTTGVLDGRRYAFVGLERTGGFFAYDISDPTAPVFATYAHSAIPDGDARAGTAGDVSPEGLCFIAAADSPTGVALLAVAHEVSGTTRVYALRHER